MKINQNVLEILSNAVVKDNTLTLQGQLDRKEYQDVAKVIELLGGKWNKSQKCHVFPGEAEELVDTAILTGEVTDKKKEFQFFSTPPELAKRVVEWAEIESMHSVLEPSAGTGALVNQMTCGDVDCLELMTENFRSLIAQGYAVANVDFLTIAPKEQYDRVIMNPPFCKGQDIAHVTHALKFLRPGGILVAILSPGFTFRKEKKYQEFNDLLDHHTSEWKPIEEGAFKSSGTLVNTVMLKVIKNK